MLGEKKKGTLSSLGYENFRILIENGKNINLAVIISGKEDEFLINDMKEIIHNTGDKFENLLTNWDGEEILGIEKILKPLIASGKYDGIYYGREDPKARRNLLFENVSMGLARQAQSSPTLLCIEDLQWADSSTLALMHYITRNTKTSNLVIMGTYRPEDVAASDGKSHPLIGTMQLMEREDILEKMELPRLPEESIDEFLTTMLQRVDFTEEFRKKIYKETDGNPLFVIEMVKFLVNEKVINDHEGTWILEKPLQEGTIPSKVLSVISRRMDRVENKDRKTLDYASVIGEVFDSTLLADILGMDRLQLLEQLRYLEVTHRLIHPQNGNFKFDHAKIKEALYTEIPRELRSEYHLKAANSLETLNKDNSDEVVGDLAFHFYQSPNREKALFYLDKAAEKAKKDYANEEAIRFYNFALELEEDLHRRMDIFDGLGDIHGLIANYQKCKRSYESALELTEDKYKRAEIKAKIGFIHESIGEYDESIKICKEALVLVKGEGCKEEAHAFNNIGSAYFRKGEIERALEHLKKGLEIQKKIGDQKGLIKSNRRIGNVYVDRAEFDRALTHYGNSLKIAKKRSTLQEILMSLSNIGIIYRYKGAYDTALEYLEKSLEIANKIGNPFGTAMELNCIGGIYLSKEEYERALDCFEQSLGIMEKIGSQQYISHSLIKVAYTYVMKGEYQKAFEHLKKASEIQKKVDNPWVMMELYHCYAEGYYMKRDFQRALEYSYQVGDLSDKIHVKEFTSKSKRMFGMIYREQKKWEESIENFKECVRTFEEIGMKNELAESHFEFGLMWKVKGESEKAKEQLNKALDIFEDLKVEKKMERVKVELEAIKSL
jgi:predicted ATPase